MTEPSQPGDGGRAGDPLEIKDEDRAGDDEDQHGLENIVQQLVDRHLRAEPNPPGGSAQGYCERLLHLGPRAVD